MSNAKTHIKTEKQLVPTLRFQEFNAEWEKHSLKYLLGSLVDCEHKTAPYVDESEYLVVRTNNVKDGQLVYKDIKYTTEEGFKEWTKRTVPKYGDILFTREAPAGESCLVPEDKKVCLGQRMVLLKSNENKMTGQYLSSYLQSGSAIRDISNLSIGTTVTRINIADIYKLKCPVSSIPEQQKIASFLSAVDEKIQQLTKKKELLEQYKKGVMQQLFSGQLRFKDENGDPYPDWKEKQLGDMIKSYSNKNNDKLYPVVAVGKYGIRKREDIYSKALSKDISKNKVISVNTLTIGMGSTQIDIGILLEAAFYSVSPAYNTFKISTKTDSYYLQELLKEMNPLLSVRYMITGARQGKSVDKDGFLSHKISFPILKEQQKIATYLSSIDTKIEEVNNQITQTQTFKKGLLQQMFV